MALARDDVAAPVRQPLGHRRRHRRRRTLVLGARDDRGRNRDAADASGQLAIRAGEEAIGRRIGRQIVRLHPPADAGDHLRPGGAEGRREPALERRRDARLMAAVHDLAHARLDRRALLRAAIEHRVQQHQPLDPGGRGERKALRHQPAHREPGEHERSKIEPVGERAAADRRSRRDDRAPAAWRWRRGRACRSARRRGAAPDARPPAPTSPGRRRRRGSGRSGVPAPERR